MKLLKENKGFIILTGLAVLLPMAAGILLWDQLPETLATHFGPDNEPNGWSSRTFAVFGLPLFCFAAHLVSAAYMAMDPRKQGIGRKVYRMMLLICPGASLMCGIGIYSYALSWDINAPLLAKIFMGIILITVGNYLPKIRQNYTVGLKLPWTLYNEENWNKTHRFAGGIWILAGAFFILDACLNLEGMWIIFTLMIVIPVIYSLLIYLREHKQSS